MVNTRDASGIFTRLFCNQRGRKILGNQPRNVNQRNLVDSWNRFSDQEFQVGARVKRISVLLTLTLLAPNLANAATPTPTKSPTPTVKASAKPTITSTSKATVTPTVKASATAKKKVVYKPRPDRKSTRLNSSHIPLSRMPSSA